MGRFAPFRILGGSGGAPTPMSHSSGIKNEVDDTEGGASKAVTRLHA